VVFNKIAEMGFGSDVDHRRYNFSKFPMDRHCEEAPLGLTKQSEPISINKGRNKSVVQIASHFICDKMLAMTKPRDFSIR
jgi:hypothetical protein